MIPQIQVPRVARGEIKLHHNSTNCSILCIMVTLGLQVHISNTSNQHEEVEKESI